MKSGNRKQKRIRRTLVFALTFLMEFFALSTLVNASEEKENSTTSQLYALSAVLMDADNGRILLEKNGSTILPMASTTKIMTCILALEQEGLSDMASVSAYAASQPKVHLGAQKGEYYKVEDLLYSLMLESHNDAAVIIAEHYGAKWAGLSNEAKERTKEESCKAVYAFTAKMNQKAKEIGCSNTFFVTPNGLDGTLTAKDGANIVQKDHSTTARDLAQIMRYCIMQSPKKEEFLSITRTGSYQVNGWKKKEGENAFDLNGHSVSCTNHNAFLQMMEGALSGKTGFTTKAGYCYVGALQRQEKTFVVALLACGWPNNKTWKWHDARILMNYGLDNYELHNIYEETSLEPVTVNNGQESFAGLYLENKKIELLLQDSDCVEVRWELPKQLDAPLAEGDVVGRQLYFVNGELYDSVSVKILKGIDEITFQFCLRKVIARMLL